MNGDSPGASSLPDDWPIIPRERTTRRLLGAIRSSPARLHVIEGPAGIGKSELARTVAERLPPREIIVVTALTERSTTPLGALDEIAPGGHELRSVEDAVESLSRVVEESSLVVDDAPRLDEASAEVIRRLIVGFGATVIATARTEERLPSPLALLDGVTLARHTVEGLSIDETSQLIARRFRVPGSDGDVQRLVWETDGNPLHLRVYLESAIGEGRVLHRGSHVEISDSAPTGSLRDLVRERVRELPLDDRRLLDLVMHAQPVSEDLLASSDENRGRLPRLTRRGFLASDALGRIRIAHPLVAEAIAEDEELVASRDLPDIVSTLRASGNPIHRFAAVVLEQDSSSPSSPDDLLWAASYASARGEPAQAARFAEAALAMPLRRALAFTAGLAAARYRSLAGDLEAAEEKFANAEAHAATATERAALASGLGEHLAFRRGDASAAIAHGMRARAALTAPAAVALDAELWRWRTLAERQSNPSSAPDLPAAIAATVAASMRGEPAAAAILSEPLDVPGGLADDLSSTAAIARGIQRLVQLRAESGVEQASRFLETARAGAGEEVGFFTLMHAAQRLHEGRLQSATRLADLAIDQLGRWDAGELLPLALAVRATVSAHTGAIDDARDRLARLDAHSVSGAAVLQRAECRAHILAAQGDRRGAADETVAVVEHALTSGYRFFGAITLSTALRFGEVSRTHDLITRLSADLQEPVEPIAALSDLVESLVTGRTARVPDGARRLAHAGLVTAAIDGASIAARSPASEQTRRRLRSVITALSAGTDARPSEQPPSARLTVRQQQIASAAAERLRSREIAERLGVTPRTIDNQLHTIYRKLGVSSRDELREALEAMGTAPSA